MARCWVLRTVGVGLFYQLVVSWEWEGGGLEEMVFDDFAGGTFVE